MLPTQYARPAQQWATSRRGLTLCAISRARLAFSETDLCAPPAQTQRATLEHTKHNAIQSTITVPTALCHPDPTHSHLAATFRVLSTHTETT